jgi:hypothetical protein
MPNKIQENIELAMRLNPEMKGEKLKQRSLELQERLVRKREQH